MKRDKVIIVIRGGVVVAAYATKDMEVEVLDYDDAFGYDTEKEIDNALNYNDRVLNDAKRNMILIY